MCWIYLNTLRGVRSRTGAPGVTTARFIEIWGTQD